MGITAARETLDAAESQKVQNAASRVSPKDCQISRQKNRQARPS
jgi:hypothetical protein